MAAALGLFPVEVARRDEARRLFHAAEAARDKSYARWQAVQRRAPDSGEAKVALNYYRFLVDEADRAETRAGHADQALEALRRERNYARARQWKADRRRQAS